MAVTGSRTRCFVGLALDAELALDLHQRARAILDERDWNLHAPEDLHVTLCFLGDVADDRLPGLRSVLSRELAGQPAPTLRIHGCGSFGDPASPRVLWAGVQGEGPELERLRGLREAAARAIEASELAFDSAATFTPHVTLARPRRRTPLPAAFSSLACDHTFTPGAVILFGSVPLARPHYPRLESFPLRARDDFRA